MMHCTICRLGAARLPASCSSSPSSCSSTSSAISPWRALFGVRVETFSIGFGREIVGWTDKQRHALEDRLDSARRLREVLRRRRRGEPARSRRRGESMTPEERAVALPFKPLYQRASGRRRRTVREFHPGDRDLHRRCSWRSAASSCRPVIGTRAAGQRRAAGRHPAGRRRSARSTAPRSTTSTRSAARSSRLERRASTLAITLDARRADAHHPRDTAGSPQRKDPFGSQRERAACWASTRRDNGQARDRALRAGRTPLGEAVPTRPGRSSPATLKGFGQIVARPRRTPASFSGPVGHRR